MTPTARSDGRSESCAAADGVHHLIQLGDFGYWPKKVAGRHFLDELDRELERAGSHLWWLRGNHEDQHALLSLAPGDGGLVPISDRIRWIPDGTVINWAGRRILVVGGAPSIDADERQEGVDWFPTEVLSEAAAQAAFDAGPVEVVLSHDCPAGVDLGRLKDWEPGDNHRALLAEIAASARPRLWAHGHYRRSRTSDAVFAGRRCQVESLGSNHQHDSVIYLHPDLTVTRPSAKIRRTKRLHEKEW